MSTQPRPPEPYAPAISVLPMPLPGLVARLEGTTLYLNPTCSADDQLAALADAVRVLQGARPTSGRKVRHLSVVGGAR